MSLSQQEQIRRMFVKGVARNEIRRKLGIRYQIVFKACNPKYAPKVWTERLTNAHAGVFVQKKSRKVAASQEAAS